MKGCAHGMSERVTRIAETAMIWNDRFPRDAGPTEQVDPTRNRFFMTVTAAWTTATISFVSRIHFSFDLFGEKMRFFSNFGPDGNEALRIM